MSECVNLESEIMITLMSLRKLWVLYTRCGNRSVETSGRMVEFDPVLISGSFCVNLRSEIPSRSACIVTRHSVLRARAQVEDVLFEHWDLLWRHERLAFLRVNRSLRSRHIWDFQWSMNFCQDKPRGLACTASYFERYLFWGCVSKQSPCFKPPMEDSGVYIANGVTEIGLV